MRSGFPLRRLSVPGAFAATRAALSTLLVAVAVAAALPSSASAQQSDISPAVEAGFDPAVLERIETFVDSAMADGVAPGGTVAIGRSDGFTWVRSFGVLDTIGPVAGVPTSETTIWDLASLTKVIGTTSATMALVEEGSMSLDDRVAAWAPSWITGDRRKLQVTIRQLMTHRAGLPAFRRWYTEIEGREAYDAAIDAEALEADPGERYVYSDIGVMTLARVVEQVSGGSLDSLLQQRVFGPTGMTDTGFNPDPALRPRIAPTEIDTIYRGYHVHGEVHDENAHAYGGVSGHAGLFSTARDLSRFARMMLREGVADSGERIFQAGTVRMFTRRQFDESSRALGWDTPSGRTSSAGRWMTEDAFGHTGYTGTSIWIDPELDLFVIVLTNRVNPTRANTRHAPMRREVANLAVQALTDRDVEPRAGTAR